MSIVIFTEVRMDWSLTDYVCVSLFSSLAFTSSFLLVTITLWLVVRTRAAGVKSSQDQSEISVAFFHPYCNAGGGGERVLWSAVKVTQTRYPAVKIVIYTGDTDAAPDMILAKARDRFNMNISDNNLSFVYLHKRRSVR